MAFVFALILLVLGFDAGWFKELLRGVCLIGALALGLWLPVRVFDLDSSTIIMVVGGIGLAFAVLDAALGQRFFPKRGLPKTIKGSRPRGKWGGTGGTGVERGGTGGGVPGKPFKIFNFSWLER